MDDDLLARAQERLLQGLKARAASRLGVSTSGIGAPIDMSRPKIQNEDGSFSTERTITVGTDRGFVNIPTIIGGRQRSNDEAIQLWKSGGNPEVGKFNTEEEALSSAQARSQAIGVARGQPSTLVGGPPSDGAFMLRDQPFETPDAAAIGKVARTAAVGSAPGAVTAMQRIDRSSPIEAGIDAFWDSWTPNLSGGDSEHQTGPGLQPSLAQIKARALTDPKVGRAYYQEWAQANALRDQVADQETVVNRTLSGDLPERRPIRGMPPEFGAGGADLYSATKEEANKQNAALIEPSTAAGLAKRAFQRLSRGEAGPEYELQRKFPWVAATAEIPGETVRMLPALAAGAATAGLGAIPSAIAFDAVSQAQRINAGGQESWSPEQSAVNLFSQVGGGLLGRMRGGSMIAKGASADAASTAAARMSNAFMLGAPVAIEATKGALGPDKMDWGDLTRSLYKSVVEAGALSTMPGLSPAHPDYQDPAGLAGDATSKARLLARERAEAMASGDTAIHDALAFAEQAAKRGKPEEETAPPSPAPTDETNPVTALQSAQDALIRAGTDEATLRESRDQRRAALRAGMEPEATEQQTAAWDAMNALAKDMRNEPPGSAKRLYFGSEEYTSKIADQFGVTDESNRKLLREYGADLILEPHEKAAKQGGFARVGTTPAEKAELQQQRTELTDIHQAALAEGPDWTRQFVNRQFDRLVRGFGGHPTEAPLISRTDRGIDAQAARDAISIGKLATEKRSWDRSYETLLRMAPKQRETLDTLFTSVAGLPDEQMQAAAVERLPQAMRAPFEKALADYHEIQTKIGHEKAAVEAIPEELWAVPYRDEAGNPQIREVATRPGEPPPEGGNLHGLGKPYRIGGRAEYAGHYVHQTYENSPTGKKRPVTPESKDAYSAIDQPTPSSSYGRTKSHQEFLEQGVVSMEPTQRSMERDFRNIHRLRLLDYIATRPDLYRPKGEFEADVEQTYAKQSVEAPEKIKEVKKQIAAHKKEMAKKGLAIYAGESGELTRAMKRDRAGLSRRVNEQRTKMGRSLIPDEGMPPDFNPDLPGNKRRAREIRREQAKYRSLVQQMWTHGYLEDLKLLGAKPHFFEGEAEANLKLRELHDELLRLESIKSNKWELLKSNDFRFGRHEGKAYIRKDALREIDLTTSGNENSSSFYRALSSAYKFNRVAGNPIRSFFTQMTGNVMMSSLGGIEMTPKAIGHWLTATEQAFKYLWSEGKNVPDDPLFHELVDAARTKGSLALYDAPAIAKEQLFARIKEARELMEGTNKLNPGKHPFIALHRAGIAIADAMRYYPGQIPIFGKGTRLVAAMDLIPQYAMYRQLRTGDGSLIGKLSQEAALEHTGYFYDMGDVPRWVQKLSEIGAPTFARFAYKAPTAAIKWMMASPPTLGTYIFPGLKLDALMQHANNYALEHAGTPKGAKAIWGIKALNLSLNVVKLASHFAGVNYLAAKALGIDPGSKEYQDKKKAEVGGSAFRALFLVPYRNSKGELKFFDFFNLAPGTNVFSLGTAPDSGKGYPPSARAVQYVASLNWLTNAIGHIYSNTDYAGEKIPNNAPFWRGAFVGAAKNFIPGGLEMPASALLSASEKWSQKSPLEALAQALLGVTIRVSKPWDRESQRLRDMEESGDVESRAMPMGVTPRGKQFMRLHERAMKRMGRRR